jgi:UPF0755 protein
MKINKWTFSILATIIILQLASCNDKINVPTTAKLYIPTNANFEQIIDSIGLHVKDVESFKSYAKSKKMDKRFYSGRYTLLPGMKNSDIVKMIQEGKQDEIPIRIGNYSSIMELAGKMGAILEADSSEILNSIMSAQYLDGLDTAQRLYGFIPNTYNFHWNTSGNKFVEKMQKEFENFWTTDRLTQAKTANMSPLELTTLASIVQLESSKVDEQPKVAGLYLNRLRMGMKLDADPTIVFIKKQQSGFTEKVQRVYYKDLEITSPYNTYKNKGLPPSPICMPNPSAIDAVLQPEKHEYIYFVADVTRSGYHVFTKNFAEHQRNAAIYRAWADKNNVK